MMMTLVIYCVLVIIGFGMMFLLTYLLSKNKMNREL
jgi:hypothetical protein